MKHYSLALILLLVACTSNKQSDINPTKESSDWAEFENIFSLSKSGVETKIGLTFFENDSIRFRLESSEDLCTLNFQGMAISPSILFSADHFENENHNTHLIDNYLLQDDDIYINIGVEIDCTSVWIEFLNVGDLFECVPDLGGILKKD